MDTFFDHNVYSYIYQHIFVRINFFVYLFRKMYLNFLVESIGRIYLKGRKYMINKHKLCKMALVSAAVILMLVNITGARSFHSDDRNWGCGDVILKTNPVTQSVDFLKFPACGYDGGYGFPI